MKAFYFILLKLFLFSTVVMGQQGTPPWIQQESGVNNWLYTVCFANENTGFAGGDNLLLRTTNSGATWDTQDIGYSNFTVQDITFVNQNTGFAVISGQSGSHCIRTTNAGLSWTHSYSPHSGGMSGVSFHNENTGIVVGSWYDSFVGSYQPRAYRTINGGLTWIQLSSVTGGALSKITFISNNHAICVGWTGWIVRVEISTNIWNNLLVDPSLSFNNVYFQNQNAGFVVGSAGTILRTNNGGNNWTTVPSGTTNHLYDISFFNHNDGVAVGANGTILRTTDGGLSWNLTSVGVPPNNSLRGIDILSSNTATVVGHAGLIFRGISVPILVSPPINSIEYPQPVKLEWQKVQSATSYKVEVAYDDRFTNIYYSDSTLTDTTMILPQLDIETKYYWRVRAKLDNIYGGQSALFNFTTFPYTPTTSVLFSPLNNSIANVQPIELKWKNIQQATNYKVEVASDLYFTNMVFSDSLVTDTSLILPLLSHGEKYFWKVTAKTNSGYGPTSSAFNFKTLNVPLFLNHIFPLNGYLNQPVNLTFLWSKGFDYYRLNSSNQSKINSNELRTVSNYWFELVRDPVSMTGLIRDTTLTDTLKSVTGLSKNTNYYWRVRAKNEVGWGSFNNWWTFRTVPNVLPVANTLTNIYNPDAGRQLTQNYTFTSSGSYDPDGVIDSVQWYVNDKLVSTDTILTHPFPQGITFVRLVVYDDDGASASSTATVTRTTFRRYLGGPVYAGLSLIGDSILYAVASNDKVYKMDIDGNLAYYLSVNGNVMSSSSISYDSSVFIGSSDNNLYGFSRYGAPLWPALTMGGQLTATPTIDSLSNRLYMGISNGFLHVVNKNTGNIAWSSFLGSSIGSSAVITLDRKLVLFNTKGDLYGFDLNSTSTNHTWFILSNDSVKTSPALDNEGNIYIGTRSGKFKKITLPVGQMGHVVWELDLGSPVNTSAVIDASGFIYVGLQNGRLVKINSSNGEVIWTSFANSRPINTSPALSMHNNRVYFGNNNGEIFALDSSNNLKWYYRDSSAIGNALLYDKGTLYAGTISGRVLAIYDDTSFADDPNLNPPAAVWGTFQGNNRRTGSFSDIIISIENVVTELPKEYYLSNNYPNPFNPSTKIRYGLPQESNVKIAIYDILGKEIGVLINENQKSGTYEITFNAGSLPSGVYFFRIVANDFISTKRMVLLK